METRTNGLEAVSGVRAGDWWQLAPSAEADIVWTIFAPPYLIWRCIIGAVEGCSDVKEIACPFQA